MYLAFVNCCALAHENGELSLRGREGARTRVQVSALYRMRYHLRIFIKYSFFVGRLKRKRLICWNEIERYRINYSNTATYVVQ